MMLLVDRHMQRRAAAAVQGVDGRATAQQQFQYLHLVPDGNWHSQ
jgi:hypothetical protein